MVVRGIAVVTRNIALPSGSTKVIAGFIGMVCGVLFVKIGRPLVDDGGFSVPLRRIAVSLLGPSTRLLCAMPSFAGVGTRARLAGGKFGGAALGFFPSVHMHMFPARAPEVAVLFFSSARMHACTAGNLRRVEGRGSPRTRPARRR